ncbi:hypothetical protein DPMN_053149 [Dreissena polymorpha]|uniref:Uncharacterized protein n=1 Tax=Dreissena polymorpha TaxID=45954 RepID=A0A9D4CN22_DREPO|nr:hypothetical protein DPMN_053149 [Dreissena polymorpha]
MLGFPRFTPAVPDLAPVHPGRAPVHPGRSRITQRGSAGIIVRLGLYPENGVQIVYVVSRLGIDTLSRPPPVMPPLPRRPPLHRRIRPVPPPVRTNSTFVPGGLGIDTLSRPPPVMPPLPRRPPLHRRIRPVPPPVRTNSTGAAKDANATIESATGDYQELQAVQILREDEGGGLTVSRLSLNSLLWFQDLDPTSPW